MKQSQQVPGRMGRRVVILKVLTVWLMVWGLAGLFSISARAAGSVDSYDPGDEMAAPEEASARRIQFDLDWDLYYTSAAVIMSLTKEPIPLSENKSEFEIYRDLLKTSYLPRYLLFEVSAYPMPCLGAFIKENARGFYDDSEVISGLNLVKAITAGFDEPYALSVFAGNVVTFRAPGEKGDEWNNGYMGYLFSFGDYHIKDNELIYDKWYELEWKLKGDLVYSDQKLSWSFRTGVKIHGHPDINDAIYLSLRRSRLDFAAPSRSIWRNSGFEYTFNADKRTLAPISHEFSVEKKWPLRGRRFAFSLITGFVWESDRKYLGSLSREKGADFQVFIRPNVVF